MPKFSTKEKVSIVIARIATKEDYGALQAIRHLREHIITSGKGSIREQARDWF